MLKSAVLAGPRLSTPASWGRVLQAARCAAHSGRAAEPPQDPNGRLQCGRQARPKSSMHAAAALFFARWSGSFQIKWTLVKDIPNNQFRHIVLANNEGKPVTNSRDTQEVMFEQVEADPTSSRGRTQPNQYTCTIQYAYSISVRAGPPHTRARAHTHTHARARTRTHTHAHARARAHTHIHIHAAQGKEILRIFHNFKSKTSILDDFGFYDKRQELAELRTQMAAHGVPPPGPPQPIPPHMSGMPMDPMQMPGMPLAPPMGVAQPSGVNGGGFTGPPPGGVSQPRPEF